jgi:hypothetical protein
MNKAIIPKIKKKKQRNFSNQIYFVWMRKSVVSCCVWLFRLKRFPLWLEMACGPL